MLENPGSDVRILLLTRNEEQRLLERLENLKTDRYTKEIHR